MKSYLFLNIRYLICDLHIAQRYKMNSLNNVGNIAIEIDRLVCSIYSEEYNSLVVVENLKQLWNNFVLHHKNDFSYCNTVNIFISVMIELNVGNMNCIGNNELCAKIILNKFFEHLDEYNKDVIYREKQRIRNLDSLKNYIESLINHYSRLLFVRLDLSIDKLYQNTVGIFEFNNYLKILNNRMQNKDHCFRDLHGYAWSIEQGVEKGFHAHMLFIYDGNKHQNDFGMAMKIGNYWKELTSNMGIFFTSNDTHYKQSLAARGLLGIGMIHRNNPFEVQNAINAAGYLVQPEKENQHLRVKVAGMRSFGKANYDVSWRRKAEKIISG